MVAGLLRFVAQRAAWRSGSVAQRARTALDADRRGERRTEGAVPAARSACRTTLNEGNCTSAASVRRELGLPISRRDRDASPDTDAVQPLPPSMAHRRPAPVTYETTSGWVPRSKPARGLDSSIRPGSSRETLSAHTSNGQLLRRFDGFDQSRSSDAVAVPSAAVTAPPVRRSPRRSASQVFGLVARRTRTATAKYSPSGPTTSGSTRAIHRPARTSNL